MNRTALALCFFALAHSLPVFAESYKCNGTWTNKPCDESSEGFEGEGAGEGGSAGASDGAEGAEHAAQDQNDLPELSWDNNSGAPETGSEEGEGDSAPEVSATPKPAKTSRCAEGETWVDKAPEPNVESNAERLTSRGGMGDSYKLTGHVTGNGKVEVVIKLTGRVGSAARERKAWSQTFSLPVEGGSKQFETRFDLPPGWQWVLNAGNTGRFPGYCAKKKE